MIHFRQAILRINRQAYLIQPGRPQFFDTFYVDFQVLETAGGHQYTVYIHPKQAISVQQMEVEFDLQIPADGQFFANGFQSWSESKLMHPTEAIARLRAPARAYMGTYGDEQISGIPRGKGYLHSWSYTYIRRPAQATIFLGSLNESTGFTLFLYDGPNQVLRVRKDLSSLDLSHSFPLLDFWCAEGEEAALFEQFFDLLPLKSKKAPLAQGWTSWYRHFTVITEDIILYQLNAFSENFTAAAGIRSVFQIDDGWQTAVGDWLSIKPAFPKGMAHIAQSIQSKSMLPGLWLAPFVAAANSELVRRNPDWLLKDAKGKILRAGYNPMWGGWYYALDFYNPKVQEYLAGVFHQVLDRWGFELLKLDFLFAVCLAPPAGKTRGQVMFQAMEFLRKLCGNKYMLACGVPLAAAWGQADYCRIGGDIHLKWEHRMLRFLRHRERVSTLASLRSTLGRWQLDQRAFCNDPDVFILRDDHQHLTPDQQHTVLTINALLGSVLFTSDDLSEWSPEQNSEYQEALELLSCTVSRVLEIQTDVFQIDFQGNGSKKAENTALCNLSGKTQLIQGGKGNWIQLKPYETLVLDQGWH
jgi:alpha-galactosidase